MTELPLFWCQSIIDYDQYNTNYLSRIVSNGVVSTIFGIMDMYFAFEHASYDDMIKNKIFVVIRQQFLQKYDHNITLWP